MTKWFLIYIQISFVSIFFAFILWLFLSRKFKKKRSLLFFVATCFFIPMIGVLEVMVYLLLVYAYPKRPLETQAKQTNYPTYTREWSIVPLPYNEGEAYKILFNRDAGEIAREKALAVINSMYSPEANLLNQKLLNDEDDEIRLHCFGLLNEQEKVISEQINETMVYLSSAKNEREKALAYKRLAFLYWELIYQKLIFPEMIFDISEKLVFNVENALKIFKDDSSLYILLGCFYSAIGNWGDSFKAFNQALTVYGPCPQIYAYLAELCYQKKDFKMVKQLMRNCLFMTDVPKLHAVVDFWAG